MNPIFLKGLEYVIDADNALNRIIYSELNDLQLTSTTRGVSIKYVYEGAEAYYFEGENREVKSGQFLVVNHDRPVEIDLKTQDTVKGICLYVDPKTLANIERDQLEKEEEKLDNPFEELQDPFSCRELIYPAAFTPLHHLIHQIRRNKPLFRTFEENTDWFYQLAYLIWTHERRTQNQITAIHAIKKSTREELYRRLLKALDYIHNNYSQKVTMASLAKEAHLSEFHFLRSFKQCFGMSPNRYLLQVRMEHAKRLLKTGHYTVSTVAELCGFSDLQYFSRTFKRIMGVQPSLFMRETK